MRDLSVKDITLIQGDFYFDYLTLNRRSPYVGTGQYSFAVIVSISSTMALNSAILVRTEFAYAFAIVSAPLSFFTSAIAFSSCLVLSYALELSSESFVATLIS